MRIIPNAVGWALAVMSFVFIALGVLACLNIIDPEKPIDNISIAIMFIFGAISGVGSYFFFKVKKD
jgi:hypothetical protein